MSRAVLPKTVIGLTAWVDHDG